MSSQIRYANFASAGFWLTVMSIPTVGSRLVAVATLKIAPLVRYCARLALPDVHAVAPLWRKSA